MDSQHKTSILTTLRSSADIKHQDDETRKEKQQVKNASAT